jgi:hypothetical protein
LLNKFSFFKLNSFKHVRIISKIKIKSFDYISYVFTNDSWWNIHEFHTFNPVICNQKHQS